MRHRHTSCSTQGDEMGNWPSELDPNARVVHGSLLFCGWPLSLGVLIICAGEGSAHRVDHVQTHPHPEDISQAQFHPQNQKCGYVSLAPSLLGI